MTIHRRQARRKAAYEKVSTAMLEAGADVLHCHVAEAHEPIWKVLIEDIYRAMRGART